MTSSELTVPFFSFSPSTLALNIPDAGIRVLARNSIQLGWFKKDFSEGVAYKVWGYVKGHTSTQRPATAGSGDHSKA